MNADDFRDYMLAFLFLRYLSDNYESAVKKELGKDYPKVNAAAATNGDAKSLLASWYAANKNAADVPEFEKQMRRKVHYVIQPDYLWDSIVQLGQDGRAGAFSTRCKRASNASRKRSLSE